MHEEFYRDIVDCFFLALTVLPPVWIIALISWVRPAAASFLRFGPELWPPMLVLCPSGCPSFLAWREIIFSLFHDLQQVLERLTATIHCNMLPVSMLNLLNYVREVDSLCVLFLGRDSWNELELGGDDNRL